MVSDWISTFYACFANFLPFLKPATIHRDCIQFNHLKANYFVGCERWGWRLARMDGRGLFGYYPCFRPKLPGRLWNLFWFHIVAGWCIWEFPNNGLGLGTTKNRNFFFFFCLLSFELSNLTYYPWIFFASFRTVKMIISIS